jgi:putative spermidine/putrescine transport system substrate-binding protein
MRARKQLAVAALLAAAAMTFAGCSKSDPKTTEGAETPTSEVVASDAGATEAGASEAAPATEAAAGSEAAAGTEAAPTTEAATGTEASAAGAAANEAVSGIKAPDVPMATAVGKGEGALNLIAWAGYTEKAWVDPFALESGCKVNVKTANTSDEMVQLIKTGEYDGLSASGDASLRLIAAGDVAPVNTDLVSNYADVYPSLKLKPWNSVGGKAYGVPHGRGINLMMYRTDKLTPAPDSLSVVFDAASPAKGSVTAYDSPIYIADAAIYLMATKPELAIKNPFALDATQLAAAKDLLIVQKGLVSEYWSDYLKQMAAFKSGSMTVGTSWQVIVNSAKGEKTPVEGIVPKEGTTGWSDTWMVAAKAKNPNCMYAWMNYIISPAANAAATEFYGEAPSNPKACGLTSAKDHCTLFHADDEEYFKKIWYWTTPVKDCLDGRGPKCTDYAEWTKVWTEVKG